MELVLEQNRKLVSSQKSGEFGQKIGLAVALFGCWHGKLSRPFIENRVSYRTCLKCGARKRFDSNTFSTFGAFYYPPTVQNFTDFL